MGTLLGIILGVVVLTILIVLHELGHAIVARRNGVVVEEFGVGFPPRAWSKKIGKSLLGKNVLYSVNWLPLGGFVKMQGEHDADLKKGDYGSVSFWKKTKILLAGVMMNWLTAVVLFTILALVGLPKIIPNQFSIASDTVIVQRPVEIAAVGSGSPADKAGLKIGDQILKIGDVTISTADNLAVITAEDKGKTVLITYKRGGVVSSTEAKLRVDNSDKKGYLGVSSSQQEIMRATWSAPIVGVGTTAQLTWVTLQSLGDMLAKGVSGLVLQLSPDQSTRQTASANLAAVGNSVAGPVGIFGVIFPAAEKAGLTQVVLLSAIISLTLAVMNILPIPALDGGRWFVTALYRLMKRPLGQEIEEKIHGTGFMILMGLVILITIADIGKLH